VLSSSIITVDDSTINIISCYYYYYWLWSDDADPRSTDRFAVLRCFTSAAYRTSPSTN